MKMFPKGEVRTFRIGVSQAGTRLFEAWREAHLATFDVAAQADQIEAFQGSLQIWATRRFILSKGACTAVGLLRSRDPPAGVLLDHLGIRLIVEGNVKGDMGTHKIVANAGDIVCFDLEQAMRLETSTDGDVTSDLTLWVPRARLQSIIADETLLHSLVVKCTSPAGAMLGATLRTYAIHADDMSENEMDQAADGVVELAARLLASSLRPKSQAAEPTASFVTIRRFIDRHLQSRELGVDMIAKTFGLSRASLYRLFEPIGGIASYVRNKRLDRAYQEIAAAGLANRRIGPIAYRCGFKSVAAFNRAFHETYGINPTQARSAASRTIMRTAISSSSSDAGVLAKWLLELSHQ
jgi:AraC-like DNA-binding protein